MPRTIAYLGPTGTYTEEAALLYDPDADLQPFSTIAAVGSAVSTAITDQGVVPIENSLEGAVNFTLDLLISQPNLYIYQEVELPIQHYLMASAGVRPNQVEVIYSHPQSLGQCREFLERCFPSVQQMASLSNAAAVNDMKKSSAPAAAIAPGRNAELYGVEIIGRNIQDNPNNVTRFVVLATYDHPPTGNDKTSLCLSFRQDAPGVLYRALQEFANREINLRKIESRPTKQLLGEYIFLVDCDGHREDQAVKEAIDALNDSNSVLKVLGSYPRWAEQSTK
jgi:prephenate dehydratase